MTETMKFGEYLRKKRKYYGMSQYELADELGVQQTTVSSWELGKTSPPFDFALDIIKNLGGFVQFVDNTKDFEPKTNYPYGRNDWQE